MEDDYDFVLVGEPTDRDIWNPSLSNATAAESSRSLEVRFYEPANHWTAALPIVNGRLGAMVWGGVASEILNINEDTLWTGAPGDFTNPGAPLALAEVRKLVDDGKYADATEAAVELTDKSPHVYQVLGDIILEFDDSHANEENYERVLDLDIATVKVKYSVGEVEFTREYFASYPDQAVVAKISANKPGFLSVTLSLDSKLNHNSYVSGNNQIIMEGSSPGKRVSSNVDSKSNDDPEGIQFAAILDLQISEGSGAVHVLDERKLRIEGCDWVIMFLVASSSFDGPFIKPSNSKRDPRSECSSTLNSIRKFSYSEIYARHLDDYQKSFHQVSLELSKSSKTVSTDRSIPSNLSVRTSESGTISTADRVKSFKTDEAPSMVELLFQYGRYLLISCLRPGSQPANLQGIWNYTLQPPWDCAPHLNINLQMNYWPALPCNIKECQEPLFDYISSISINGSKTAKNITGEL